MLELDGRLVNIHRHQASRLDADLMQQLQTPRRSRSQNELLF